MATTVSQIDVWRAARSEHQNLEFKEAKTQFDNRKLYKYCVALANEGGGHLLLGIEDQPPRKVVGTAAFNDPVDMAATMDRNDRIRACYQHCCLRYVMNEKMTNQSLRERFNLPEDKVASVSQIIAATVDAGKIKLADPTQTSTRYRSYVPFWA